MNGGDSRLIEELLKEEKYNNKVVCLKEHHVLFKLLLECIPHGNRIVCNAIHVYKIKSFS